MLNRLASKFAAPYIQSFLDIMKTQFGVEVMIFGGYVDNNGTVNTFKYVEGLPLHFFII